MGTAYRMPPSPCWMCPHGPSGVCNLGVSRDNGHGGCARWTRWFVTHWSPLCRTVEGQIKIARESRDEADLV